MIVTACSDGSDQGVDLYAAHLPKRRARAYRGTARRIGGAEHGYVYHMLFAPDGRTVVSAYEDGTISLFDVSSRAIRKEWRAHNKAASSLDMNEDGSLLLSAGEDAAVCLWDLRSGELLQRIDLAREKAKLGQALLRPVPRELQLVCPSAWRQPFPSRKTGGAPGS
jgi:WD40 repeat protein